MGRRNCQDTPNIEEEKKAAMITGACNNSPGRGCICLGIFGANWESSKDDMLAELNQMYLDGQNTEHQKHGIVVCIPKTDIPTKPADYITITC